MNACGEQPSRPPGKPPKKGHVNRKRTTQSDVARLARVSQATVSLVVNNSSLALPPETRSRVLEAIDELRYLPDSAARSLRTRRTMTIASVIPDITNPFYPAFERGIQQVAEANGYDHFVYSTDGVRERERKSLRSLLQRGVDGAVVVLFHLSARELGELLEADLALVRLEPRRPKDSDSPIDNLYIDNEAAAHRATSYLLGRGHRRIALIGSKAGPGRERSLGYRRALSEAGVPVDERLVREADFTLQGGVRAMQELLEIDPAPSAVFAQNDLMAMGASQVAKARGLRIPEDLAVVGFDDQPAAALVTPTLTTVTQFNENLGARAAQMLFERLSGGVVGPGRREEMPFELVLRESA